MRFSLSSNIASSRILKTLYTLKTVGSLSVFGLAGAFCVVLDKSKHKIYTNSYNYLN